MSAEYQPFTSRLASLYPQLIQIPNTAPPLSLDRNTFAQSLAQNRDTYLNSLFLNVINTSQNLNEKILWTAYSADYRARLFPLTFDYALILWDQHTLRLLQDERSLIADSVLAGEQTLSQALDFSQDLFDNRQKSQTFDPDTLNDHYATLTQSLIIAALENALASNPSYAVTLIQSYKDFLPQEYQESIETLSAHAVSSDALLGFHTALERAKKGLPSPDFDQNLYFNTHPNPVQAEKDLQDLSDELSQAIERSRLALSPRAADNPYLQRERLSDSVAYVLRYVPGLAAVMKEASVARRFHLLLEAQRRLGVEKPRLLSQPQTLGIVTELDRLVESKDVDVLLEVLDGFVTDLEPYGLDVLKEVREKSGRFGWVEGLERFGVRSLAFRDGLTGWIRSDEFTTEYEGLCDEWDEFVRRIAMTRLGLGGEVEAMVRSVREDLVASGVSVA